MIEICSIIKLEMLDHCVGQSLQCGLLIYVWHNDELWARQRLFPMTLNLRGGHRASVSGGQPSWQPQHVWKAFPGHCQQTSCSVLLHAFLRWRFLMDPPPPPPPPPAPSLKWGEAERQESGWKSGFDRLRKGHGGGGEGGLWKDLWQPVNITGPPTSQHLICCLH